MSPVGQNRGKTVKIPDNLYTVILAVACGLVITTIAFVAYMCQTQYGTLFSTPG